MKLTVNGESREVPSSAASRLIDVLREELGLTGTKEGCGEGECGACTVLIDGEPVCSCIVPLSQVADADVTTIEGLNGTHPLQKLFMDEVGAQCGICTPGMIMAALSLSDAPTLDEVRTALAGNLCRCTGYSAIYRAVMKWRGMSADEASGSAVVA